MISFLQGSNNLKEVPTIMERLLRRSLTTILQRIFEIWKEKKEFTLNILFKIVYNDLLNNSVTFKVLRYVRLDFKICFIFILSFKISQWFDFKFWWVFKIGPICHLKLVKIGQNFDFEFRWLLKIGSNYPFKLLKIGPNFYFKFRQYLKPFKILKPYSDPCYRVHVVVGCDWD